jgi:hypothetical protein
MLSEFVFMHTQRGKTAFTKQLVIQYSDYIPFFVLDNNTALAVQTQQAFEDVGTCLALHSLGNTDETSIKLHIGHPQSRPIVMGLNNRYQIPKIQRLMQYAQSIGRKTLLVVDEADKTYPHCRQALYPHTDRWIFVSATLGNIHIQFPECAAAVIRQAPQNAHYCGIISGLAKTVEYNVEGYKEQAALDCIAQHRQYFFEQIPAQDGQLTHRKVLIHGSAIARMIDLTKTLAEDGWGVVCVIGPGTFAAKDGRILGGVKNRVITVAESIHALCEQYQLCNDRPLAVIGNRKMDRGITYHSLNIVFTDCILGKVANTDTAVQKAGRLAGNVALNSRFSGALTWWANAHTIQIVVNQCQLIHISTQNKPISHYWNNGAIIIGPFKHKRQLNAHKFVAKINNKLFLTTGALWLKIAYNTSLLRATHINSYYTRPFAAKINNLYYILYHF